MSRLISLGSDHHMQWFVPYSGDPVPIGIIVWHPAHPDDAECIDMHGGRCGGAVWFDVPANAGTDRPKWQVASRNPLTLTPSLACHCGDHGFITEGRWVPA